MSKIVVSLSGNSVDEVIDEYRDSSYSGSSSNSSSGSNGNSGNTTDEEYTFGVPLEVLQEQLRTKATSGVGTSTSIPSSPPLDKEEIVYSCAVGIPSKIDEKRLTALRSWYQILDDLNLRLAIRGEWCCQPRFGIGIYEAYLLGGLRLPLNAFARKLLTRLGLGVCQLNPNAWRLIVSVQVLWWEVFEGDRPLTVDKFFFCYKPSEINQSRGFYQFTAKGSDCKLIKSLVSFDRNWKTEFFFVFRFWSGHLVEVGRDTFAPYTGELGNLRPKGMFMFCFVVLSVFVFCLQSSNLISSSHFFFFLKKEAIRGPSLSKFHLDHVHRASLHADRNFHSLVNLQHLAT